MNAVRLRCRCQGMTPPAAPRHSRRGAASNMARPAGYVKTTVATPNSAIDRRSVKIDSRHSGRQQRGRSRPARTAGRAARIEVRTDPAIAQHPRALKPGRRLVVVQAERNRVEVPDAQAPRQQRRIAKRAARRPIDGAGSSRAARAGAQPSTSTTSTGRSLPFTGSTARRPSSNSSPRRAAVAAETRIGVCISLFSPSMRLARLAASPTTLYSLRSSGPMRPATTSPVWMPMPMRNAGRPSASSRAFSAGRRATMSSAARTARAGSSPCCTGAPNSAITPSPVKLADDAALRLDRRHHLGEQAVDDAHQDAAARCARPWW